MGGGEVTRLEKLEAVVGAARVVLRERLGVDAAAWEVTCARLADALAALDAHTEAQAQEPVGSVVQIAAIPAANGVAASVFALRDDGTIWGKRVDRDGAKWWRESDIPTTVVPITPQETVTLAVLRDTNGKVRFVMSGPDWLDRTWGMTRLGTFTLPLDREGGR